MTRTLESNVTQSRKTCCKGKSISDGTKTLTIDQGKNFLDGLIIVNHAGLNCRWHIFLQNNLLKFTKRDTKSTLTNHYILLTNVSIERCIKQNSNVILFFGGGEEFQPDKYLTDCSVLYSLHKRERNYYQNCSWYITVVSISRSRQ